MKCDIGNREERVDECMCGIKVYMYKKEVLILLIGI